MRLRQRGDFERLKGTGQRIAKGCLIANWQAKPEGVSHRLGVVTSRKLGSSVERSRARRLLRESFRLHQHKIKCPIDLVLVARNSIVGKKRTVVDRDLLAFFQQAGLLK